MLGIPRMFALSWRTFAGTIIATSANGRHLAFLRGGHLHIWSPDSKHEIAFSHGKSRELSVSDDGKLIATGGSDMLIKLWNAEDGEEIATLSGHTGPITGISIHPDSRRVASCSSDMTVKVWDAESGQELITPRPNIREVYDVKFSPDGRILAARNINGSVAIWTSKK